MAETPPAAPAPEPAAPSRGADLRGATRLATDATAGLANLVEAMHERIARLPGSDAALDGRTGGISGLVYKTIRGVTRVAGGSIEALLGLIAPALGHYADAAERDALVAALNGVLGDYLVASGNPLALPMELRRGGAPLVLEREALAQALPDAGPRLLVLLHGLCMNDRQWLRNGHDHGAALARDLGWTPVYLRYNSGLHVSINGHALAAQLERLLAAWPAALQRLAIVGHSMGGLVARSAIHAAERSGLAWPERLGDLVFLGTPLHGAPLERAGHWVDLVLGATPYAAPFARLGRVRSAGITDLRHGHVLDEDWVGRDRFARSGDRRQPLPLPAGVRCFALAASLGAQGGTIKEKLLGDGLVPLDSALGRHADPARALAFAPDRQWIAYGMNHLDLLDRAEVYEQLKTWLS
ncbi:MAG: alpha/beta hydrolase [Proteobacteria bacterium]|nr:alpha/beta hydrolase [Pseudomonadota bacterium]